MCHVEAKHSSSDPVSNMIYGGNPKVTTVKSKKDEVNNSHKKIIINKG